jgi:hypothetical protein
MPHISSGAVHAFYLFDVAQGVDLARVQHTIGAAAQSSSLQDKGRGPQRVRYAQPPVVIDGAAVDVGEIDGFRVRVKIFDYGVVSLMLSRPFAGTFADLVRLGQELIESDPLEQHAADACGRIVARLTPAFVEPRSTLLTEDYLAFVASELVPAASADEIVEQHGDAIAQMLRGESVPLSRQEREEILRHRLSYLADDLVVPAYNAAFICDTESGARSTLEVLELVNSQLLEFRYHDELLESELTRIYTTLQRPRTIGARYLGRRSSRAARRLHAVFIDVNELTDRMENAVKLVGDIYSARLFGLAAARLGLDAWKRNVEDKLETLDDIYRFAVEQSGMSQGNMLELIIVLILVLELGLIFAGILS